MLHRLCIAITALAFLVPLRTHAQRRAPASDASFAQASSATAASVARGTLQTPVTIRLDSVSLRDALQAIAHEADVKITLAGPVISLPNKVTLRAERMPAQAAFEAVLRGTDARMIVSGDNIVFTRGAGKTAEQGDIVGRVTNGKDTQPLAGATITLDGATRGVVTDERGMFRLSASPGEHAVHIRAVGYVRQARRVVVKEGQEVTVDVVLEQSTSVLNEVIVTGTVVATERKAIPNPITVITADEIQKRGITRIDQFLRGEVPGVLALDQGSLSYDDSQLGGMVSTQIYSRGSSNVGSGTFLNTSSASTLKIYVDGVELMDPSYLGTIDPQSVERIEIITGPQAATIYGSGAMGGVMQIFTKKGSGYASNDLALSLRYGMLESNLSNGRTPTHDDVLSISGGTGPSLSYAGTLSYNYSGQWQPDLFNRRYGASLGATTTRGKVTASGTYSTTSGKNGTSTLRNQYGLIDFSVQSPLTNSLRGSGQWIPVSTGLVSSRRTSATSSQVFSFNLDYRPFGWWQHHLAVGRNENVFSLDPVAPVWSSPVDSLFKLQSSSGRGTTANYDMTLVSPRLGIMSNTITIGANGTLNNSTVVNGCVATSHSTAYVACSSTTPMAVSRPVDTDSWGGFTRWQLGIFDNLFITLGLRGERNPSYGREHKIDWTPTNGVTYTVERGDLTVKLLGSYGSATRPPRPDMLIEQGNLDPTTDPSWIVWQQAAPNLGPEHERGPQGGIEVYYSNLGSFTLTHYRQKTTNLIQLVTADSFPVTNLTYNYTYMGLVYRFMNTATIEKKGWEGTGSLNLGPVAVKGTYSWNDSRVLWANPEAVGDATTYSTGESFRGSPTHTANVVASYARGNTSLTFTTNYVGEVFYRGSPNFEVSGYRLSYTRLKQDLSRVRGTPSGMFYTVPGYAKSDLAVAQRLNPWASLTLNVTNLGNSYKNDMEYGYFVPSLGRTTSLGVTLRSPKR